MPEQAGWKTARWINNNNNNNNNKRQFVYGLSLIPWQTGKPLLWYVAVASTLAGSYVDTTATGAGLVADQAADRKTAKYADLRAQYVFFSRCQLKEEQNLSYFR